MNKKIAMIDNNTLVYFTDLNESLQKNNLEEFNIFELLQMLYSEIHIPVQVKDEYEKKAEGNPKRSIVLMNLKETTGFLRLCSKYDPMVFEEYTKTLHYGEAGIVSQYLKTLISEVISEDNSFIEWSKKNDNNLRVYHSLVVLANLDFHGYLNHQEIVFKEYKKIRNFKKETLELAYHTAARFLKFSKEDAKKKYQSLKLPF